MRSVATPGGIRRSLDFPRPVTGHAKVTVRVSPISRWGTSSSSTAAQDLGANVCGSPGAVLPVVTYVHAAVYILCFTSSRQVHDARSRLRPTNRDASTLPREPRRIAEVPTHSVMNSQSLPI